MTELTAAEVLTTRIRLRGAALQALKCRDKQVLIAGPAGTGKSFAALWKVHLMCLKNPGMRALMVRKTHKSLTSTGLVTFREKVAKDAIRKRICWYYGGSGEKPAAYMYDNDSTIVVGGMDQADKIMSSDYDLIFAQEATDFTVDDIEKLDTRLRNGMVSFQQLLMDCNPQHPTHPLKKRCDRGDTTILYAHHTDNPKLYDECRSRDPETGQVSVAYVETEHGRAYLERLQSLTGVRKERLYYGRWAAAEGMIFDEWKPEIHISDRKVLPQTWRRFWTVDFGFRHPFVWQQWAVDDDGRLWLELEIHHTERIVEDHAKQILKLTTIQTGKNAGQPKYPRPDAIFCDHDAEDRATLERHLGMSTRPAWKGVSDGIEAVKARLRVRADGTPGLYVLRGSLAEADQALIESSQPTCFAEEIEGYVWKPSPDGRPLKEEPLKERDDSMDAGRYAVAAEDLGPRTRLRWVN